MVSYPEIRKVRSYFYSCTQRVRRGYNVMAQKPGWELAKVMEKVLPLKDVCLTYGAHLLQKDVRARRGQKQSLLPCTVLTGNPWEGALVTSPNIATFLGDRGANQIRSRGNVKYEWFFLHKTGHMWLCFLFAACFCFCFFVPNVSSWKLHTWRSVLRWDMPV